MGIAMVVVMVLFVAVLQGLSVGELFVCRGLLHVVRERSLENHAVVAIVLEVLENLSGLSTGWLQVG